MQGGTRGAGLRAGTYAPVEGGREGEGGEGEGAYHVPCTGIDGIEFTAAVCTVQSRASLILEQTTSSE